MMTELLLRQGLFFFTPSNARTIYKSPGLARFLLDIHQILFAGKYTARIREV